MRDDCTAAGPEGLDTRACAHSLTHAHTHSHALPLAQKVWAHEDKSTRSSSFVGILPELSKVHSAHTIVPPPQLHTNINAPARTHHASRITHHASRTRTRTRARAQQEDIKRWQLRFVGFMGFDCLVTRQQFEACRVELHTLWHAVHHKMSTARLTPVNHQFPLRELPAATAQRIERVSSSFAMQSVRSPKSRSPGAGGSDVTPVWPRPKNQTSQPFAVKRHRNPGNEWTGEVHAIRSTRVVLPLGGAMPGRRHAKTGHRMVDAAIVMGSGCVQDILIEPSVTDMANLSGLMPVRDFGTAVVMAGIVDCQVCA